MSQASLLTREEGQDAQVAPCDIPVVSSCPSLEHQALALSERLGSSFARTTDEIGSSCRLWLELSAEGLSFTDGSMCVKGDFSESLPRLKQHLIGKELLIKAARLKGFHGVPQAVDATAGLGADGLLLAAAGFEVTMFEANIVVALLLEDALQRAACDDGLAPIVSRMRLVCGDSVSGMAELGFEPDVVLLDPMFPARKKSAQVKKKFQLLHCLEAPCSNEKELFSAAVNAQPKKIVVKRPPKGPCLAGKKPSYEIKGKAVRYDCYVFAR